MVLPVAGETGWAAKLNADIAARVFSGPCFFPGSWSALIQTANSSAAHGVNGDEAGYLGFLNPMSISGVGIEFNSTTAPAGSGLWFVIRTIDLATGTVGAIPILKTFHAGDTNGAKLVTVSPAVDVAGPYIISLARVGDPTDLMRSLNSGGSDIIKNLTKISNGMPATGHSPQALKLNTGLTVAGGIPNTVSTPDQGTNYSPPLPGIWIKRA